MKLILAHWRITHWTTPERCTSKARTTQQRCNSDACHQAEFSAGPRRSTALLCDEHMRQAVESTARAGGRVKQVDACGDK